MSKLVKRKVLFSRIQIKDTIVLLSNKDCVMKHAGKLMHLVTTNTELRKCFLAVLFVAFENIRFSPLFQSPLETFRAEERRSFARNVPSDEKREETRNGCFRRLYCLSSIHPSCMLCIFAFLLICDGHAKILLTIVLSHSLKRPGRVSFSLSRDKK